MFIVLVGDVITGLETDIANRSPTLESAFVDTLIVDAGEFSVVTFSPFTVRVVSLAFMRYVGDDSEVIVRLSARTFARLLKDFVDILIVLPEESI